jgi:LacI family transcriptional regulator
MHGKSKRVPRFRVAWISIPGRSSYWREILRGAVDRLRQVRDVDWAVLEFLPGTASPEESAPPMIVARVSDAEEYRYLRRFGVPVVNVSGARPVGFPRAGSDDLAVGRMAGRTFRRQGFRDFAFIGDGKMYSTLRRQGFVEYAAGHRCRVLDIPESALPVRIDLRNLVTMAEGRPVGVLACNDDMACAVLQCALGTGLRVPRDVCVLGVGNEDTVLLRSPLPLSSIELPAYGIGVAAVEMLLEWRDSRDEPPADRLLPPLRVVHRATTGVWGIGDPLVRAALEIIGNNAGKPCSVSDVVQSIGGASRRTLEIRFRRAIGHSVLSEIHHARLARAKELLSSPALALKEIAHLSGFSSPQKFSNVFHRIEGCSPLEYRSRSGMGSHAGSRHAAG